jgi:prophage DNA circulation protein
VASDLDIFGNLLTASFRGVAFPAARIELGVGHSQATHLYPRRDGGRTEHLGRDPNPHTFKIPFLRSIDKALYPGRWREFIAAYADGSSGQLMHPELGPIQVKPLKSTTIWEPDKRDGCWVDAPFLESDEDGEAFARAVKKAAPYFLVESSAARAKEALQKLPSPPKPDLFDALDAAKNRLRVVAGAVDQARLSVSNVLAAIAGVVAAGNALMSSIEKAFDPDAYEGLAALSDMIAAATDQAKEFAGKAVVVRRIARGQPVESAAAEVGMSTEDFLQFNPRFADASEVPAGTSVFAAG